MLPRIEQKNWSFNYDISFNREKKKDKLKRIIKRVFGWDIRYKNFRIV